LAWWLALMEGLSCSRIHRRICTEEGFYHHISGKFFLTWHHTHHRIAENQDSQIGIEGILLLIL
jgi:hypothetical protein